MKEIVRFLLFCWSIGTVGCITLRSRNGNSYWNMFPARERHANRWLDTAAYVKKRFISSDFGNLKSIDNGKKVVQSVAGFDLKHLLASDDEYYVHLFNAQCPASIAQVRWFDSLARKGKKILLISLTNNVSAVDKMLKKTSFYGGPYYIIDGSSYSDILVRRSISFMRDICNSCYNEYRDDIAAFDYVVIGKGNARFFNISSSR